MPVVWFVTQISGETSHQLVQTALEALTRLTHRGAQDADAEPSEVALVCLHNSEGDFLRGNSSA